MSVEATRAVWKHSRARGGARLVMLALADEANDEGFVTAYRRSQSYLAQKTALDEGTVRRAVLYCQGLGELAVLAKGDGRKSSDYRLILPGLEGLQNAPPGRAESPPWARKMQPQGARGAAPIIPFSPAFDPASLPNERAAPIADAFDRFWAAYPRKRSKGQARKAWASACRKADPETIAAAAELFSRDPNLPADPGFIPYPATWLNGERWADPALDQRPAAHTNVFEPEPPAPLSRFRPCPTQTCDGTGWLDPPFDPLDPEAHRSPLPTACPSCRPNAVPATQGG